MRIEQGSEEVEALLVELQYTGEVDLEHEDRHLVRRQGRRKMPRMAASPGGISMMTPSERLIKVGSPQPIFAIGPMRNVPCCGGKMARKSLIDARSIRDHILREHDALDGICANAIEQGLIEDSAIESQQSAYGE